MKNLKSLYTRFYFFLPVFLFAVILSSCSDGTVIEPPPPPPPVAGDLPVRKIADLPADTASRNEVTYFRLSDSSIVRGNDTLTNEWDLGFKGTTIWINGGPIRYGSGGAIVQRGSSFDTVSVAPEAGWQTDDEIFLAIPTGSDNGWYSYDMSTHIVSTIPGVVLLIKTGEGKYAKVIIDSYYKGGEPNAGATNTRYYTFRYCYQPDGTRNIK